MEENSEVKHEILDMPDNEQEDGQHFNEEQDCMCTEERKWICQAVKDEHEISKCSSAKNCQQNSTVPVDKQKLVMVGTLDPVTGCQEPAHLNQGHHRRNEELVDIKQEGYDSNVNRADIIQEFCCNIETSFCKESASDMHNGQEVDVKQEHDSLCEKPGNVKGEADKSDGKDIHGDTEKASRMEITPLKHEFRNNIFLNAMTNQFSLYDCKTNDISQERVMSTAFESPRIDISNGQTVVKPVTQYKHSRRKLHSCDMCQYTSRKVSDLKRHKLTHTDEKPYLCDMCPYACRQAGQLKTHLMKHSGERPHSCDMCEYTCRQAGHLKLHKLTHRTEKDYSCDLCEYTCNRKGDMKRHTKSHTGEKPYSCDMCQFRCRDSGDLIKHKMIHSGEKPYSCGMCGYMCRLPAHLRKHMMIHTGDRPLACDICQFTCRQPRDLRRHKKIHTGEKS